MRISTEVTSKGSSSSGEEHGLSSSVEVMPSLQRSRAQALRVQNDGGNHGEDGDNGRKAHHACRAAAQGALLAACVEQHHDEGEQHHDGAGVDDDLRGGQELRAQSSR